MDIEQELQDAYRQWRRLAEAEGQAIRAGDWSLVLTCQNALQQLQPRITSQTEAARQHWAHLGPEAGARRQALRSVVLDLIDLEQRNQHALQLRRQKALAERKRLERANRRLNQVQKSYAPSMPSKWSSVS